MDSSQHKESGYRAVAEIFHRYLTGLVLALVNEVGTERTSIIVRRLFRRQQEERFLEGLEKLGLSNEPDAVACAKYHYLSNHLGGVSVAFIAESDTKAWVRYLPPRWIFDGTAIAGVPTEVARAMLWGWHANNGVLLNNPRLGFVCTGQTVDGMAGLEGYYIEQEQALEPQERLRFRFGEQCPAIKEADLPVLDSSNWPSERVQKASRNYSMDYIRNIIPVMSEELGPLVAQGILFRTGRKIGMQYSSLIKEVLETEEPLNILQHLFEAQGDSVVMRDNELSQSSWRLMRGRESESSPEWMDGLKGLWEGILMVSNPKLRLDLVERLDGGGSSFRWKLTEIGNPVGY